MSWRDEPATITQKLAIRNALDRQFGMRQASTIYAELKVDDMTKGEASDELKHLYKTE